MKHTIFYYIACAAIIGLFVGVGIWQQYLQIKQVRAADMTEDLVQIHAILTQIHQTCQIIGFEGQKNTINFLTIKEFVGSEVGPMNLAAPEHWQGPYVQTNPETQGTHYQIVKSKKRYFITPGDQVRLPNGAVIGKDIVFDEAVDIPALIESEQGLQFKGKPLAIELELL